MEITHTHITHTHFKTFAALHCKCLWFNVHIQTNDPRRPWWLTFVWRSWLEVDDWIGYSRGDVMVGYSLAAFQWLSTLSVVTQLDMNPTHEVWTHLTWKSPISRATWQRGCCQVWRVYPVGTLDMASWHLWPSFFKSGDHQDLNQVFKDGSSVVM